MASDPPQMPGDDEPHSGPDAVWQRLLNEARAGEPSALSELIESWRTYLFHLVDAELTDDLRQKVGVSDLVQSACLDIHLRFADFRGHSVEEWRGWLKRMILHDVQDARRRFVDAQRRDVRRERSFADSAGSTFDVRDPHPSPRASFIASEETEALRAALQRLPDDYRMVLRLRNWDCLTLAEVGRRMNRSEEAARKLWSRAIARLQQELDGNIES
jgi:RNA polymerase sigma-70 factor (ECF subfamily)